MHFDKIQKISDTQYLIKHKQNAKKDITVNIEIDEDGKYVEFDGLPSGADIYI